MKKTLVFIILLLPLITFAEERKWTTTESLTNNDTIKFFWVGAYKGYDAIYKFEIIRNLGLIKTIRIHGQPQLNESRKFMAIKNCWYGGCRREIRIFELSNYNELQPVQMEKTSVLNLNWQDSVLNIKTDASSKYDQPELISIPMAERNIFIRTPN